MPARPTLGDKVRSRDNRELVGTVEGLKMNCIIVRLPATKKHPQGRKHYWSEGTYEAAR